ncbi:uridine kinase family protein [Actinoplanes sp. URMC 104]|uniref:uridine kinase family protein n=1 Tax=Actinoplanes sp. URMC 104 TaxID=3423409 RepID=UPI003F1C2957
MPEPTVDELAAYVLGLPPRLGATRLVSVDGPSGAGKTRFAAMLAAALACPVVHTDDLLDGWDDQFTFWTRLEELVLGPLRRGRAATYRPYDWGTGGFTGPPVTVPPAPAVLLEGVSAARREVRPELTLSVFVDAPAQLRWERAIARDGDDSVAYRKYLERWRAAEDRHFAADATAAHADLIVDGAHGRITQGW